MAVILKDDELIAQLVNDWRRSGGRYTQRATREYPNAEGVDGCFQGVRMIFSSLKGLLLTVEVLGVERDTHLQQRSNVSITLMPGK